VLIAEIQADIAAAGFVERVETYDIRQMADMPGNRADAAEIMILQVILNVAAIDREVGREIPAGKEQRPHDAVDGEAIILRPAHHRIAIRLAAAASEIVFVLHHMGGAGFVEAREVEPHLLEEPCGRAVAARHAAPCVLVEVDEDIMAMFAGLGADGCEIVEIGFVEEARAGMFDGFPCRQQADAVETPMGEAAEMLVRFIERKGPPDEGNRTVIGKIRRMVRPAAGVRHLAVAAEIDAAQDDLTPVLVDEPISLDAKARENGWCYFSFERGGLVEHPVHTPALRMAISPSMWR